MRQGPNLLGEQTRRFTTGPATLPATPSKTSPQILPLHSLSLRFHPWRRLLFIEVTFAYLFLLPGILSPAWSTWEIPATPPGLSSSGTQSVTLHMILLLSSDIRIYRHVYEEHHNQCSCILRAQCQPLAHSNQWMLWNEWTGALISSSRK